MAIVKPILFDLKDGTLKRVSKSNYEQPKRKREKRVTVSDFGIQDGVSEMQAEEEEKEGSVVSGSSMLTSSNEEEQENQDSGQRNLVPNLGDRLEDHINMRAPDQ